MIMQAELDAQLALVRETSAARLAQSALANYLGPLALILWRGGMEVPPGAAREGLEDHLPATALAIIETLRPYVSSSPSCAGAPEKPPPLLRQFAIRPGPHWGDLRYETILAGLFQCLHGIHDDRV